MISITGRQTTERPNRRNRAALAFASPRARNKATLERGPAPSPTGEGLGWRFGREARPCLGDGSLIRRAQSQFGRTSVLPNALWRAAFSQREKGSRRVNS